MTQKVIRSPFAGIDFTAAEDPGKMINFSSNEAPSFPVDLPPKQLQNPPRPPPVQQPFPKNFSLPNQNQELSGNISLIGGGFPKSNNNNLPDILDEPPLLEGIFLKNIFWIFVAFLKKKKKDLGIDLENFKNKTLSILGLKKCDEKFIKEGDMCGPLLFAFVFGGLLMLVIFL